MKIKEITDIIEHLAPLSAQESYDNSGLLIGDPETEVGSALLCVDVTEDVMKEAERLGARLVISHHPIIFNALKRLTGANYVERVVAMAVRSDIAIYACHTNLDSVPGGMSHCLADMFGLTGVQVLSPSKEGGDTGFGVVGSLPELTDTMAFLKKAAKKLSIKAMRYSTPSLSVIRRVAVCSGSGASLIAAAEAAGAELYLSSDFKYNNFLDAAGSMTIADIGHFESEYCAIDLLYTIISKKIPTFALHKSRQSVNPVNYLITDK